MQSIRNSAANNKNQDIVDDDLELMDESPAPAQETSKDLYNQDEEGNDLGGLMSMISKSSQKKSSGKKSKKKQNRFDDDEEDAAAILARLEAEQAEEEPSNSSQKKGSGGFAAGFAALGDETGDIPDDEEEDVQPVAPVSKTLKKNNKSSVDTNGKPLFNSFYLNGI